MISTARDIQTFFSHNRISIQVLQDADSLSVKKIYLRDLNYDTHLFDGDLNYIETNKMGEKVKTEREFATNLLSITLQEVFKNKKAITNSELNKRQNEIKSQISAKLLLG